MITKDFEGMKNNDISSVSPNETKRPEEVNRLTF